MPNNLFGLTLTPEHLKKRTEWLNIVEKYRLQRSLTHAQVNILLFYLGAPVSFLDKLIKLGREDINIWNKEKQVLKKTIKILQREAST